MEKKINFTFKKHERLRKQSDFKRVFDSGKSLGGVTVAFYFVSNNVDYPRAGFIASKKISKRAVDRNRAKRLMREVFRLNKHKLKPVDIIFIARKGILGKKYHDVESDFLKLAKKADILREE
ncbi:Ribonuclease P protein component [Desulfurobacterium thermolithotrophum DSM 11699]|uniref:Ribonuclease P protein component n=1 Tax=Desulfurobacterium thermolithotrophum (strain DSM 11699 / BSA) TaxID=868864 RepID=F0S349_DESTD|nr:ribonuclease P protein component [Desulfurobacterium thermolithotrophum]ADY73271.1 Ribonuclease P protein component [Desulfurobacterium thermolithotrophum DSM 11699]